AEACRFRDRLDQVPSPPARDMEAVHEDSVTLIELPPPGAGQIGPGIEACVEVEQKTPKARPQAVSDEVMIEPFAHGHESPASLPSSGIGRDDAGDTGIGTCATRRAAGSRCDGKPLNLKPNPA